MDSLLSIIVLMFAAALLVGLAQRVNLSYPMALVIGGTAIGFIPGLKPLSFDPNLILVVVLPPILYRSSFSISFREFKANWREIFSLALGLVFLSTLIIGLIFKWFFPELPWALAFAFGAIVSPPDAVSATAIIRRFPIDSRLQTILEGESLINDASALVLYRLSVVALLSGIFSWPNAIAEFFIVVIGGIAVGLALGFLLQRFSRRYLDPVVGVVFSITIPYITYIAADALGVSGVLAVVTNGLVGSQTILSHPAPLRRIIGFVIWDIYSILLNCFIFILIGLQLNIFVSNLTVHQMLLYIGYGCAFTLALIVVRMIWVFVKYGMFYYKTQKGKKKSAKETTPLREAVLIGWSGMRGIVSLTAALALPLTLPDGAMLAGREAVIFITFVVILLTLLIPGFTLSSLIVWLKLSMVEHDHHRVHKTRKKLEEIATNKIEQMHALQQITHEQFEFLSHYFKVQRRVLEISSSSLKKFQDLEHLRLEVIREQRKYLLEIWHLKEINDQQLRNLEHELDLEETRIARAEL
jgi:monovalent cation/hydrogen antiporter